MHIENGLKIRSVQGVQGNGSAALGEAHGGEVQRGARRPTADLGFGRVAALESEGAETLRGETGREWLSRKILVERSAKKVSRCHHKVRSTTFVAQRSRDAAARPVRTARMSSTMYSSAARLAAGGIVITACPPLYVPFVFLHATHTGNMKMTLPPMATPAGTALPWRGWCRAGSA